MAPYRGTGSRDRRERYGAGEREQRAVVARVGGLECRDILFPRCRRIDEIDLVPGEPRLAEFDRKQVADHALEAAIPIGIHAPAEGQGDLARTIPASSLQRRDACCAKAPHRFDDMVGVRGIAPCAVTSRCK